MVNDELLKFVREQSLLKIPKEQITAILKPGGWTSADVEEAFALLEKEKPAVTSFAVQPIVSNKKRIIIASVAGVAILAVIVAGVWYFLKTRKTPAVVKETPVQKTVEAPTVPAPSVPSPAPVTATPSSAVFSDNDLLVKWAKIPDDQNGADAIIASGKLISKSDTELLRKYFSDGYDAKNLPPLSEATAVGLRNVKVLTAFTEAFKRPFFQCSILMTPEKCGYQPVRTVGQLLLLRSFLLEKAGKFQESLAVSQTLVDLGRKITAQKEDLISSLIGWAFQKNGYERILALNSKVSTPFTLSSPEKASRILALKEEQKNIYKFLYTYQAEWVEYLADKNKRLSLPLDPDRIATADEYRKAITPQSFNSEETKKYYYDSYKVALNNVDVACGGTFAKAPYDFSKEVNLATTTGNQAKISNYIGKILYWTQYATFDSTNVRRCEVETLINKL